MMSGGPFVGHSCPLNFSIGIPHPKVKAIQYRLRKEAWVYPVIHDL